MMCRRCRKKETQLNMDYCPDCVGGKDWTSECEVCGAKPVVAATGLCGPCTFGESETVGGNW